jgi:hypothetical protein
MRSSWGILLGRWAGYARAAKRLASATRACGTASAATPFTRKPLKAWPPSTQLHSPSRFFAQGLFVSDFSFTSAVVYLLHATLLPISGGHYRSFVGPVRSAQALVYSSDLTSSRHATGSADNDPGPHSGCRDERASPRCLYPSTQKRPGHPQSLKWELRFVHAGRWPPA